MKFQDRVAIAERLQNTDPEAARLLTATEKRSRELEAENVRLRDVLTRFREFVIRNAVVWELGSNHHNPMWMEVAEALVGRGAGTGADDPA
jgi:hypothetical protein